MNAGEFLEYVPEHIRDNVRYAIERIRFPRGALITAPTGAGKTYMSAYYTGQAIEQGFRVIYLVPTRAVAYSHQITLQTALGVPAHVVIGREPGRWVALERDRDALENASLVISTYHKGFRILKEGVGRYFFDFAVFDEIHTVRYNRFVEFLALNFKGRAMALSATIRKDDAEKIAETLDLDWIDVKKRPTNVEFIASKPGQLIEIDGKKVEADVFKLAHLLPGKIIIFVSSRRKCRELRERLQNSGFTAFEHNAGLSDNERKMIEREFTFAEGKVVLVATTTLALGVSLPADHVIITISRFKRAVPVLDDHLNVMGLKEIYEPVSKDMIIQMIGRAGRKPDSMKHYAIYIGREPERFSRQIRVPPLTTETVEGGYLYELVLATMLGNTTYKDSLSYALYGDRVEFWVPEMNIESMQISKEDARKILASNLRFETAKGLLHLPDDAGLPFLLGLISNSVDAQILRMHGWRMRNMLLDWVREVSESDIFKTWCVPQIGWGDMFDIFNFASYFAYGMYVLSGKYYPLWVMLAGGVKPSHAWMSYIGVKRSQIDSFIDLIRDMVGEVSPDKITPADIMQIDAKRMQTIFSVDRATVIARLEELKPVYHTSLWKYPDSWKYIER